MYTFRTTTNMDLYPYFFFLQIYRKGCVWARVCVGVRAVKRGGEVEAETARFPPERGRAATSIEKESTFCLATHFTKTQSPKLLHILCNRIWIFQTIFFSHTERRSTEHVSHSRCRKTLKIQFETGIRNWYVLCACMLTGVDGKIWTKNMAHISQSVKWKSSNSWCCNSNECHHLPRRMELKRQLFWRIWVLRSISEMFLWFFPHLQVVWEIRICLFQRPFRRNYYYHYHVSCSMFMIRRQAGQPVNLYKSAA